MGKQQREPKLFKCYSCGNEVIEWDMLEVRVPLKLENRSKYVKRKFHKECYKDYQNTMDDEVARRYENDFFFKTGELVKEILGVDRLADDNQFAVFRINGLRIGKYIPNGNNVRGLQKGYSFETIYNTFLYSKLAILKALDSMEFKDQRAKINYMMKIVTNNINFIDGRMKQAAKAQAKVDRIIVPDVENNTTYVKQEHGDSKVQELLQAKAKSIIANDDEDYQDLFN